MTWIDLYNFLGIKEFIFFISSPQIQDMLFPVKLVFVSFSMFFLAMVIYFMINSSWLQYKFLEDTAEFFAWQAYGSREMTKKWNKIKKRLESGAESDYKLAIIDADDFLIEVLDNGGYYDGDSFEDSIKKAEKLISSNMAEITNAHEIRNSIVYNPDYKISTEVAKKTLDVYEVVINSIGLA
jgi:hypothetical protein